MAGTLFENNLSPYLTIVEATEPAAPSAGQQRLYIDSTTHLLKATNSSGTDRTIEGVPAGAVTSSGLTMNTARLLGRTTASSGAIEEITVGSGLSLSAGALTATGSAPSYTGVKCYNSGTQSVNNTSVALTFDSEEFDVGGFHSTASNTSRIVIPSGKDGYYLLQAGTFASGGSDWIGFKKTVTGPTTTVIRGYQTTLSGAASYRATQAIVQLAATDYVECWVSTPNNITFGHASLLDAQSWFAATLLGA
jgi:hypothetical protein